MPRASYPTASAPRFQQGAPTASDQPPSRRSTFLTPKIAAAIVIMAARTPSTAVWASLMPVVAAVMSIAAACAPLDRTRAAKAATGTPARRARVWSLFTRFPIGAVEKPPVPVHQPGRGNLLLRAGSAQFEGVHHEMKRQKTEGIAGQPTEHARPEGERIKAQKQQPLFASQFNFFNLRVHRLKKSNSIAARNTVLTGDCLDGVGFMVGGFFGSVPPSRAVALLISNL